MDSRTTLRFAEDLVNWYWQHGVFRSGDFTLSPVDWLRPLYEATNWMEAALPAREQERPAMAIWGPSQTGKSTSISAYIDGKSPLTNDLSTEGTGTGLHWEGGTPFRFMAPLVENVDQLPSHMARRVLNPFNKGADGSSCLTRFTAGSLEPTANRTHVRFPAFPVALQLVERKDLWHALARGYGSECSGPGGKQTRWDLPRFRTELERFKKEYNATLPRLGPEDPPRDRAAFERLLDFVEILQDLASVQEKASNFYELASNREEWEATLRQLLQEPVLSRSPELTELFIARILWDGVESIGNYYTELADVLDTFTGPKGSWKGKTVYCSLEATALFLNMSAPEIALEKSHSDPESTEGHIHHLIRNLQWTEEDGAILVGCDPAMGGESIGDDAMFFSNLQSLVWELTVPINLDHLAEQPFTEAPEKPNAFKEFLDTSDLLDFAGVGNDSPAEQNKLIVDPAQARELEKKGTPPPKEAQMTPYNFFAKVLKRGKTASIVATYAKRLNIDGFSIFQGVRGHPCPNAGQLIQGIEFWWKFNLPEFHQNPRGKCPSPLNLVLTWWSQQLNYADDPKSRSMYDGIKRIVESLGILRDPEIVDTFAIHYHNSPDKGAKIVHDFSPGSERYETLWSIKEFKHQFGGNTSRKSFDAMITDRITGGAEFFFLTARDQMRDTRLAGVDNRLTRIDARIGEFREALFQLLREPNLFPEKRPKDTRKEHLQVAREAIRAHLAEVPDRRMKDLNFHFRELFSIRAETLEQPPSDPEDLDESFLAAQYRHWIQTRLASFPPGEIGLGDKEDLKRFLTALVESVKPDFPNALTSLQSFACNGRHYDHDQRPDLRPHLAVLLSNMLIRGVGRRSAFGSPAAAAARTQRPASSRNSGSRYYRMFLEPLIGEGQRLDQLIDRQIVPVKREAQRGDEELVHLVETHKPEVA